MSDPIPPVSIRIDLAQPAQGGRELAALAAGIANPNESMRAAISLGMQKLAFVAQKERFSGTGPFAPAQNRLGVVTGRLRRDLHAEEVVMTATGYSVRIGSVVEYFGAHEVGFDGTVQVPAHTRSAYTVNRKARTGTSKRGKSFSVRANQYSVLSSSVRAHSKRMKVSARKPLRTAIEQHGANIIGKAIRDGLGKMNSNPLT
jgi:hypothetical protein